MQLFSRLFPINMALRMPKPSVTYAAQALLPVRFCICCALMCLSALLSAQTAPTGSPQNSAAQAAPVQPAEKPSISLTPAVVRATGGFRQTLSHRLPLTNPTARDFAFEMVAEDVVVKDGKRVFVTAGETPNSIAASAVFTQKTVLVKPFSSAAVDVRLTLPAETSIRAVVAMFRG